MPTHSTSIYLQPDIARRKDQRELTHDLVKRQSPSFSVQNPSFSVQIHHFQYKIHHFQYKVHRFQYENPLVLASESHLVKRGYEAVVCALLRLYTVFVSTKHSPMENLIIFSDPSPTKCGRTRQRTPATA